MRSRRTRSRRAMSDATGSDTAWKRTARRAVAASTTWAARSLYRLTAGLASWAGE